MTSKWIIKRSPDDGRFHMGGKGDHKKYKHPTMTGHVVVPHPRKDLAIGTLRSIQCQPRPVPS